MHRNDNQNESPAGMNIQSNFDSALLDAILNTAVDAIITIDERGTILHANRAVEKMFGFAPQYLAGKNVSVLMPEPNRSQHDGYIKKYQETGKRNIIGIGRQVLGQKSDGVLIPVDLAISEVRVGSRVLYTGIMRDMTERQQTEADLKLAQLQLIQSERLAAIGQMMTGLAHESRNALQRSRACLDMLDLDLESSPEQHDLVRRTRSALMELQTLYEEVRSYAAPIHLDKTKHQLSKLCVEVWDNLDDPSIRRDVQLIVECDECPAVPCDAHRIKQVIRNIYENSLAVAPDKSVIHTTCHVVHRDRSSFVQLCITDDGPGLNDEQRERIFEPFFTTKTKGTGLGMAICQRLCEAHGGRIFVGQRSHRHPAAKGAVIVIELPI
jgi:two-component system, LuxR family, sensor kinase FixL